MFSDLYLSKMRKLLYSKLYYLCFIDYISNFAKQVYD